MKEKLEILLMCTWLLVCGSCWGGEYVETKLTVSCPEELRGEYECLVADFGGSRNGGNLAGTVVYPKANRKGCNAFDKFGISFKSSPEAGGSPIIVLVDRGDCFFALKTWRAQESGAAAILITDYVNEALIAMNSTSLRSGIYRTNITIPSFFITKSLGDSIKKTLSDGNKVNLSFDLTPKNQPSPIKYELWTSIVYQCGPSSCDVQTEFIKNFRGVARMLEQQGLARFTPHYRTWYCPPAFIYSRQCRSQCINHGRYCVPDHWLEFSTWYEGKDVLVENLRGVCVFKEARERGSPWIWWDYFVEFAARCLMNEKYNKECADQVIGSLGFDVQKIDECTGDPSADMENPVLKAEEDAQNRMGLSRDETAKPILVINNKQYKGALEKEAVLQAICEGFEDTMKPTICSQTGIKLNATYTAVSIV